MDTSRSIMGLPELSFSGIVRALAAVGPAWLCVAASLTLTGLGIYVINIATSGPGMEPMRFSPLASRQIAYAVVGIAGACLVVLPNHRLLGHASWVLYGLAIVFLVFLLIPGVPSSIVRPRSGARGWIDIGPVNFQPSEFAKLAYVLVLAWYLRFRSTHRTLMGLLPPAIITAIPVGLITIQPDLGSASLFIPALFAMVVAAGARFKHLILIVLLSTLAAPAMYPLLRPHQQQRFVGIFMQFQGDTSSDQEINMQSVTAQRLIAAGGMTGLSEDYSRTLIHFSKLPERHNDMIFAVVCNRFGVMGAIAVLGLFVVWGFGAVLAAARCKEPFGRLIIVGVTGFMCAQVVVNVGMNIGLMPITGIALPFVTFGGTGMVGFWAMTGLVVGVTMRQPAYAGRRSFEWDE